MTERPTAILVLGMHRSGTSAITRVLSLLGLQLPNQLMSPVAGNNETGFWESERIADIHDRLLAEIGSAWDDCLRIPASFSGSATADKYASEILEVLDHDFDKRTPFVIKDPRVCRLVPFWLDILSQFGADHHLVLTARHPTEVAGSLEKRDHFHRGKSLHLWLRHLLDMERDSRSASRSVITYARLLDDWRSSVETIGANLNFPWPRGIDQAAPDIDSFLSSSLRHHRSEEAEPSNQPALYRWAHEVYAAFDRASIGDPLSTEALDGITAKLDAAEAVFAPAVAAIQTSYWEGHREVEGRLKREHELSQNALIESHRKDIESHRKDTVIYETEISKVRNAHLRDNATYQGQIARTASDLSEFSIRFQQQTKAFDSYRESAEAKAADLDQALRETKHEKDWLWDRWHATRAELEAPQKSKIGRVAWFQWTSYLAVRRALIKAKQKLTEPPAEGRSTSDIGVGSTLHRLGVVGGRAFRALTRPFVGGIGWIFLLFNSLWEQARAATRRTLPGPTARQPTTKPARQRVRRPRVLLVSPYPIYPPHHGGGVRLYNLIQRLAGQCELHLLVFSSSTDTAEEQEALSALADSVHFHHWQPNFDHGWWHLQPPNADLFYSDEAAQQIAHLLATRRIDILQLEYAELGQYGLPEFANVKVVLTEHDLAFRQHSRRRKMGFHQRFPEGNAYGSTFGDWLRLVRYEIGVCRRADQIHIMSVNDGQVLSKYLDDAWDRIRVVPNAVDTAFYDPTEETVERNDVLYVGNFQNLPNVDALQYLAEEIWPMVRAELPRTRLKVVGAHPSDRVTRFHGLDGIEVVGGVPDLRPYYHRHRLMVAPIRAGSGTRLKILEAFASGLPVVSTSLGAEGIEAKHNQHLLLADDSRGFADAVIALLRDSALVDRLSTNALSLARASYDWHQSAEAVLRGWDELQELDKPTDSAAKEKR